MAPFYRWNLRILLTPDPFARYSKRLEAPDASERSATPEPPLTPNAHEAKMLVPMQNYIHKKGKLTTEETLQLVEELCEARQQILLCLKQYFASSFGLHYLTESRHSPPRRISPAPTAS